MNSAIKEPFDVAVIGGGINGAAIARDAALRGLKVILLEKEDFGSGASTKTSKLAHGGLRYLEHFELGLVRESLKERSLLLQHAPHLTHPLAFILPIYSNSPHAMWQIGLGLRLYDFLGGRSGLPRHKKLSKEELAALFPQLEFNQLEGGYLYSDVQMRDNRLIIENLLSAEKAGAVIFNYAPVIGFTKTQERIDGVLFRHPETKNVEQIKCQIVVNATGAWSDEIHSLAGEIAPRSVYPTKGVHLVIPQISKEHALILRSPQDKRVFFVLPWDDYSLVGTTDTFYQGDPDCVRVSEEDLIYLLNALQKYFPDKYIQKADIIASFAGLRPLPADKDGDRSPSAIAREHKIEISGTGIINVLGGKYTTHRKIAEEVVDMIKKRMKNPHSFLPCITAKIPFPGASGPFSLDEVKQKLLKSGLNEEGASHLIATYGTASLMLLNLCQNDPKLNQQICSYHPHLFAEIAYAIHYEHAKTLGDWFFRRTTIAYSRCRGMHCLNATALQFASILGWSSSRLADEKESYQKEINESFR